MPSKRTRLSLSQAAAQNQGGTEAKSKPAKETQAESPNWPTPQSMVAPRSTRRARRSAYVDESEEEKAKEETVSAATSVVDVEATSDAAAQRDENDDYCGVCTLGGTLVCCDGCVRAYHLDCLPKSMQVEVLQSGDDDEWKCMACIGYSEGGALALVPTATVTPAGITSPPASEDVDVEMDNDDECQACGGEGRLVCCDGCVRAFHPECLPPHLGTELEQMDDDEQWFCMFCRRRAQGDDEDEEEGGEKGKAPAAVQSDDEGEGSPSYVPYPSVAMATVPAARPAGRAGGQPSAAVAEHPSANKVKGPRSALTSFLEERGINARRIRESYFQRTRRPSTATGEDEGAEPGASASTSRAGRSVKRARADDDSDFEDDDIAVAKARAKKEYELSVKGGKKRSRRGDKGPRRRGMDSDDGGDSGGDDDDDDRPLMQCMACSRPLCRSMLMADIDPAHPLCQLCKAAKDKKARKHNREKRSKKLIQGTVLAELHREIPTLQQMCIKYLVDNIDLVESFGIMMPDTLAEICRIVCKNRKLTPDILPLFIESAPVTLSLTDCANLEKTCFKKIAWGCPNLTYLRLEECGKLTDEEVNVIANNCEQLVSVTLHGAYLVTENGYENLINHLPMLADFDVSWSPKISARTIQTLSDKSPRLRRLILSECSRVTDDALPPLARMHNLEELALQNAPITDDGLLPVLPALGEKKLAHLSVALCTSLTDSFLQCVADHVPNLESLNIDGLVSITDPVFAGLIGACPRIRKLNVRDCVELTDDTVTALLTAYGPRMLELSLSGLDGLSVDTFRALVRECHWATEILDVSWCRAVDDEIVEDVLRNFKYLQQLSIWGCHRVTEVSYGRAPARVRVLGGMHI